MGSILNHLECQSLTVGGVEDHVHLLASLSRTCSVAEVVKELRRGSSLWIKEHDAALWAFGWQSGCGAFSIGFSQVESVCRYVARQQEHHRRCSFQEEFRRLIQRYQVAYDEKYVWD